MKLGKEEVSCQTVKTDLEDALVCLIAFLLTLPSLVILFKHMETLCLSSEP